jgi:uncharacterized protein YkwD
VAAIHTSAIRLRIVVLVCVLAPACGAAPTSPEAAPPSESAAAPTVPGPAPSPGPAPTPGTAPTISSQPQGQTVTSGEHVTLTIAATGTGPLSYQWYSGTTGSTASPVAGATASNFTTPALTATSSYWVRVSNAFGSVDSVTAVVTVIPPTQPTQPTQPPGGANPSWESEVVTLVNQRRAAGATCGGTTYAPAPALVMNEAWRAAARGHSEDMATRNYFSHTSYDGRTFSQRMSGAGYSGAFPWGENIAAGQSSPAAVVNGWMNSTGHCANIMNPAYRAIGVGYAYNAASSYRHYWTQNFGGS